MKSRAYFISINIDLRGKGVYSSYTHKLPCIDEVPDDMLPVWVSPPEFVCFAKLVAIGAQPGDLVESIGAENIPARVDQTVAL